MRKWTEQQWDAITARGGTVLVSAAAGSGKTSVLVERVIGRLTDPVNPTPADKLLIVTFTNAAAAEMRERVENAVLSLLDKEPENAALRQQYLLVPKMNISTVHSFCAKLTREFFYLLDIAPDYRIVSDKQREDLMSETLIELTEECFEKGMYELADAFSTERDDKRLYKVILELYEFTSSHLFPQRWLESKLEMYSPGDAALSPWGEVLLKHLQELLGFCAQLSANSISALEEDEKLAAAYGSIFAEDLSAIQALSELCILGDWNRLTAGLRGFSFTTLRAPKGYAGDPLKERLAAARDKVKESIQKAAKLFCDTQELCNEDIASTAPLVGQLARLSLEFGRRFGEKKREKRLADYGDLEHWTIQLLLEEKDGIVAPSPIARELSARFQEIMVDEYQDTNEVQDWIFRALSRDDGNKFMVGDVKQCIYSFRQAMPDIFMGYKQQFTRYNRQEDSYPATVVLDKNYRSRSTVIDSVNYVFRNLMSKSAGGVDYVGDEALSLGASFEDSEGFETQLDFLEKSKGIPQEISEARHIAATIKELMASGLQVTERGERRPVRFRDFAILLRSANRFAFSYAKELESCLVPAWAQVAEGFFTTPEISGILAFLKLIDNPNQDIPLLSVLMGPVYGFDSDAMASLRLENRGCSLYAAVLGDKSGRFTQLLMDLGEYRLMAAQMPSDQFLDYLYAKTGYEDLALAMEGGEGRLANLRQLRSYAGELESTGYAGLSGFVRFVERLRQNKADLEGASLVSENADVVRVMSIHKSKGLEFPICILAGCGRRKRVETAEVVLNSRLGLGLKLKEPQTGARYTNIIREAILLENRMEEMSEELRVLYVAMTRAKEKLITVTTVQGLDSSLAGIHAHLSGDGKISPYAVKSLGGMGDWLLLCALRHPDGQLLRDRIGAAEEIVDKSCETQWNVRLLPPIEEGEKEDKGEEVPAEPDMELLSRLKKCIAFSYPHGSLNSIPVRVTASALAKEQQGQVQSLSRPGFLSAQGLTPAERGIALHSYMQFCSFAHAAKDPQLERDRLVREGFITAQEGEALNLKRVRAFFAGELGRRMVGSSRIYKEQRFTANISASLVDPSLDPKVEIMLQGAVDCAFLENGRLYIVDFKTDRMEDMEELANAYGLQLKLYAAALTQVMELPIGGCYLYSLYKDREIAIL